MSRERSRKNTYFMACVLIFYFNWIIGTAIGLFLGIPWRITRRSTVWSLLPMPPLWPCWRHT